MSFSAKLGGAFLELFTDDKRLDQGLKDARKKVTNEIAKTQGDADKLAGGFGSAIGRFATGAAVGKTISALGDAVREFRAEDVEIQRLAQNVENAGTSWDEYGATIERVIASRQRLAYSDSQLRESLSILVTMTGSVSRALQLQNVALDLARGKNISLAEASTIIGKVATGNVAILQRQGIVVAKNATAQEALDAVSARFAGNAERYAATAQGAADRTGNALANLRENIGAALQGTAPVLATLATSWSAQGNGAVLAAGAVATWAKAGKGSIPVLSGLRSALGLLGIALKGLFLNPIGLAVIAIAGLIFGLKLLYDRSERFREIVGRLGEALLRVFGPVLRVGGAILGWIGDRLGDVALALGLVGDAADENLGQTIPNAAEDAKEAIKGIGPQIDALRGKFKPAGVDATADFLKSLGVDDAQINEVLDTIYDTVGGTAQSRFTKITDQAYARIQKEARDSIFAEADAMADIVKKGGDDLLDAAAASGMSVADYMTTAQQKTKEAQGRLELWTQGVGGAIQKARELGQTELVDTAARERLTAEILHVHDLRDAWDAARAAAWSYNGAVVPSRGVFGPQFIPQPPPGLPPSLGASTRTGGVTVVQTNHFAGGGSPALADQVKGATLDGVTQAYAIQAARSGLR